MADRRIDWTWQSLIPDTWQAGYSALDHSRQEGPGPIIDHHFNNNLSIVICGGRNLLFPRQPTSLLQFPLLLLANPLCLVFALLEHKILGLQPEDLWPLRTYQVSSYPRGAVDYAIERIQRLWFLWLRWYHCRRIGRWWTVISSRTAREGHGHKFRRSQNRKYAKNPVDGTAKRRKDEHSGAYKSICL